MSALTPEPENKNPRTDALDDCRRPVRDSRGDELYPFEVLVSAGESPLREDPVALCSQVRTVSIGRRIETSLGSVPTSRIEEVDEALEYGLGLREL